MEPDWRTISEAMRETEPVFVVGCNRSGTSVLRATLARHPAFVAVHERSPETRVFAAPERVFHVRRERGRALWRYMLEDAEAARALKRQLGHRRDWSPGDEPHWIRLFFHHAWRARGARRGLEKTPRHVGHLDLVFECFPRARVPIAIRHPVDVLSSLRKRRRANEEASRWPRGGGWQHFGPSELADAWSAIARVIARRTAEDAERCRVVRYEDLTAEPERVLEELCAFVGEPFEREAMLAAVEVRRDAAGSPVNRGRIAANPKQWSDWLDESEARELEDRLESEMGSLGYARYT